MKGRFQNLLEERIRVELESKAASLASGTAKDYAEYKEWVGYRRGLTTCLELCAAIERESE